MPRLVPKRETVATQVAAETSAPQRIETTLLVVEPFKDRGGGEYRAGDRALLRHRNVRIAAQERPELFVMEYETAPVDQPWLRDLDGRYEAEYQQAKRGREEAEARRQRELCAELEAQSTTSSSQKELERRFERQEKDRAEEKEAVQEERERQRLEAELAAGDLRHGFHFQD
jgi:hypothetical protein